MTLNDIREHVAVVNQGSGCIVQPEGDPMHSYILTAKHVICENDNEIVNKISISRFELGADGNWQEINIAFKNEKLLEHQDYFLHPDKEVDIALIRIPRIDHLDKLIGTLDLEKNREEYILVGYPHSRRKERDTKAGWYASHEKTVIKERRNSHLTAARVPNNPDHGEVVGISGGGILFKGENELLLGGIQIKMLGADENFGSIEFTPFYHYQRIVEYHKDILFPILTDQPRQPDRHERELIKINIDTISEDKELKQDLIELIKNDSELVIFNYEKQEAIINECNEELFRNYPIATFDNEKRTKFRKRIGTGLFKILKEHAPKAIDRIIKTEKHDSLGLLLSFDKDEKNIKKEHPNYSPIPWEYLYYPANLKEHDLPFPLIDKMVIIRQTTNKNLESPIPKRQHLSTIVVRYLVKEDFDLFDMKTERTDDTTGINNAVNALASDLRDHRDNLKIRLNIKFNFQALEPSDKKTFKSKELATILTTTAPNILHVTADLYDPDEEFYRVIGAINEATSRPDEERLSLIILQQPAQKHRKGQYHNYDKIANILLNSTTGLGAVMSIPFSLGQESDFFTIPSFYKSLMEGEKISECFFRLTKKIDQKEGIALPMLYLKQSDFAFTEIQTDQGQGDAGHVQRRPDTYRESQYSRQDYNRDHGQEDRPFQPRR